MADASWTITLRCKAGHETQLAMTGPEGMVRDMAQILDGTHPMYVVNPRQGPHESSWIGHCMWGRYPRFQEHAPVTLAEAREQGACGELFEATVIREEP